MDETDVREA